jgi:hypothetical protein
MQSFFDFSTVMSFVVMDADCTNANTDADAPSSSDPTDIRCLLKLLQRHPKADVLRETRFTKILDDLVIVYNTHERSIYRGTIDGKVVLLCRQVDGIAVACSDPSVALGLREFIAAVLTNNIAK